MITKSKAIKLIKESKGRIFGVTFVKKDKSTRTMTARLGVTKHLRGGKIGYSPKTMGMITVYDLGKKAYRTVNFQTVREVRMRGKVYKVA